MHFHRVASMRKALALLFAGLTPIPAFLALIAYKIWLDPIVALAAPDVARASMVALAGSVIVSAGLGAVLGWRLAMSIDDPLRHVSQFAVFGLADRPQLGECVLGAAPAASAQQPDRLIDHRSRRQGGLQLDRQRHRLGEDVSVVHGDRCGFGEQFPEFDRVLIEDVLVVGVHVDRPDHLIGQQQRQ